MVKQVLRSISLLLVLVFSSPVFALTLEGKQIQGGLITGKTQEGTQVFQDGNEIRVSPGGYFLLGFGRDHPEQSVLELVYPDGKREKRMLQIEKRSYQIQRIDGLPKRKVTPKKMDYERIKREAVQVKQARKLNDNRTDYLSGWQWPVVGPISGVYGSQRILNGKPRRPHFGVDVAAPVGTLVVAPADGIVTLSEPDLFFSGGTLIIDHGQKLSSSFLHLNKILVEVGTRVRAGDPIAEVGKTGRVTGAHLDWRMNIHRHRIDPQLLVPPMKEQAAVSSAK